MSELLLVPELGLVEPVLGFVAGAGFAGAVPPVVLSALVTVALASSASATPPTTFTLIVWVLSSASV